MEARDLVIVGGGPAGLAAGIYAARAALNAVLIERDLPGGLAVTTNAIDNYPGFPEGVSGAELADRMEKQARRLGLALESADVSGLESSGNSFNVYTSAGIIKAGAVIVATGVPPRRLNVEGEQEYTGRGVSYCATCDGPFYQDKRLAVVGGGNTAVEEADYLTNFAEKVYVIHRKDTLIATKAVQDKAFANDKIEFIWNSAVLGIDGGATVNGVILKDMAHGGERLLQVDGVFIYTGNTPLSAVVKDLAETDSQGYIITDEDMNTSCPGLFAAGDVRRKTLRQVVTAVADGAVAAMAAKKYLTGLKKQV